MPSFSLILVKALSRLHAQLAFIDVLPQVVGSIRTEIRSNSEIMLLDVKDNVQTDSIHSLKGTTSRSRNRAEKLVNLSRLCDPVSNDAD